MQKITVLIKDCSHHGITYPWPLIYTVEVASLDDADVLKAVTAERMADLGVQADELELELICAFPGAVNTCADWRE